MDVLKPATKVTAFCIGIILLAAIFCVCLFRYLKIDYPVPEQAEMSCRLYADADYEERALFSMPYTACKAGSRSIIDIHFQDAPWLLFTDAEPGSTKSFSEVQESLEEEDGEVDEEEDGDRGYGKRQFRFYLTGRLYVYPDREDERFTDFMKEKEPVHLTTARVTYDDGREQNVKIGSITLLPQEKEAKGRADR